MAKQGARCDYGIYLGASVDNYDKLPSICNDAVALKMYLNETYTTLRLDDVAVWMKVGSYRLFGPHIRLVSAHMAIFLKINK